MALLENPPAHWGLNFTQTIHQTADTHIDPHRVTLRTGHTVLVIGAGRGIGEHIAKAYAYAKSARIIITARTASDLVRVKLELLEIAKAQESNLIVDTLTCDASNLNDYQRLHDLVVANHNARLDTIVYNAGGAGEDDSIWESKIHKSDIKNFEHTIKLNYTGLVFAASVLMPLLMQGEGKTFIDITSSAACLINLAPTAYSISKLAASRLVESIGAAYANEGLLAFALHPGTVNTASTMANSAHLLEMFNDDVGLAGAFCVWLTGEKPTWLSGRHISATWDVTELESMKDVIVVADKLKFKLAV